MRNQQLLKYIAGLALIGVTACSPSPPPFTLEAKPVGDESKIVIEHVPPQSQVYQPIHHAIQQSGEWDAIASDLNNKFSLPQTLTVYFQECGENASNGSAQNKIELCYEFLQQHVNILGADAQTAAAANSAAVDVALLTLFHELGHTFIQQYQLPITGSEENAADAFAALMLSDLKEEEAVLTSMELFDVDGAEQAALEQLSFWNAHGFNAQRYANIGCMIDSNLEESASGSNQQAPSLDQQQRCQKDFQDHRKNWDAMLSPYRRQTSGQG
ncbi:hypothetical protein C1752_04324 [Acaryochloris thomasi RCC1774]|uniref:Metallopeptidase n=1 Tax=Acaryochloris thomasi RCC1774 TaxID=1764569 RepID=A0A2W1JKC9_9CYAN|nr:DUF4344 domain-containing metallopeptidase [Acaryochloris thomasi]PZD71925.1 hypothetical protein C1752_04324 [Acaryochloris thomasi RCC1774]